ncbi:MAG: DUF4065 domain-containing protein [Faecalibacterium sp.]|nr:DUF4065 domain-containing protein [Ruminococcus sp.]MCM1391477.1 DUF4065 domain-containing protein [Ruminococcus sp.]MCM1485265.1 DUF4065 domain-containing protein [Faecalibacterium sp.]
MISVNNAANFFIYVSKQIDEDFMTNLKLNKLLFYAQGCHLSRTGEPLFDADIEAWKYGPVVSEIYRKYKVCGSSAIETVDDDFAPNALNGEELETLLDVMREYGKYTATALVAMTHKAGTPWSNAMESGNSIITRNEMISYFNANPVKRLTVNSEIVDVLPNDWYDSSEDAEWEEYL